METFDLEKKKKREIGSIQQTGDKKGSQWMECEEGNKCLNQNIEMVMCKPGWSSFIFSSP